MVTTAKAITTLFKERMPPEHAVLLGKGKSLDSYKPGDADGAYVLGINEVPTVVPCDGVVYVDHLMDFENYDGVDDIFRPISSHTAHNGRGYKFMAWPGIPPSWAECWLIRGFGVGTGAMALSILGEWGCRKITLWGFDAMRGVVRVNGRRYADIIGENCYGPNANYDYTEHNAAICRALDFFHMEWTLGDAAPNS